MLTLRVLRYLFAGLQPDVGFLPIRTIAGEPPAPPQFSRGSRGAHLLDFHFEQELDRILDFALIRAGGDFEAERAFGIFLRHAFFGDDRTLDDFVDGTHARPSDSFLAAVSDNKTCSCPSRS